jgi:hypothetical protein
VNARIQIAWAQVELGRFDDAFATLNQMVDRCDQHLVWIAHDPALTPLRSDARFAAVAQRAGF